MKLFPATHTPFFMMVGDVLVDMGQWKLLKEMLAATHAWVSSHLIALPSAKYYYEHLFVSTSEPGDSSSDGSDDASSDNHIKVFGNHVSEDLESGPLAERLQLVRYII